MIWKEEVNEIISESVIFKRVPRMVTTTTPPMETVVESIIREALNIDLPPGSIQRAHRLGLKRARPRDIVVNFLRYKDKERVRKAAPQEKPTYYNTKIYFNDDYSKCMLEKRKVPGEEMSKLRQQGKRARLSHDKLMFVQ